MKPAVPEANWASSVRSQLVLRSLATGNQDRAESILSPSDLRNRAFVLSGKYCLPIVSSIYQSLKLPREGRLGFRHGVRAELSSTT